MFHFPALPIMDIKGDVIGSDGKRLACVMLNGDVLKPIINFTYDLNPVYSVMLTDNDIMLIVSQKGMILTYETSKFSIKRL